MITVNDLLLMRSMAEDGMAEAAILKDLIKEDQGSVEKKEMTEGVKYYDVENSQILAFDFRKFFIDTEPEIDWAASNNKIVNAFHTVITDQKNGYICGKPVTVVTEENNVDQLKDITDTLGQDFDDTMCSWELNSTNKGVEALHVYIDKKGNFKYVIIPAQQIIWIYESRFQQVLKEIIRYYEVEIINANLEKETRLMAEWWTDETVTFYSEDDKGNFKPEEGKENIGHFVDRNDVTGTTNQNTWGKVPFIPLPNNNKWRSDLYLIKSLIDDFDFNTSDFSNILRDHQENVWNVKGALSTDPSELRRVLKVMRIALTDINGGLESLHAPIEKDARDSHLDRMEDNIYIFGQGVNPKKASGGGNITNVFIKALFSLLDMKSNRKIRKMEKAIREFIWFVNEFNKDDGAKHNESEFEIVFNKSIIINELEATQIAIMAKGVASDKTVLSNLPIVNDVEKELKMIAEQEVNIFEDEDDESTNTNDENLI